MELKECYKRLEGSYDEVIGRLRSERLVKKFVLKFLNDGSYALLCDSLEKGDREEAFRAAHTLKGVCQNLAFTRLYHSSSELTEALRSQTGQDTDALFAQVAADYRQTAEAIEALQASEAG